MFCTNCGAQVSDDMAFCTNCGVALQNVPLQNAAVSPGQTAPAASAYPQGGMPAAQVPAASPQPPSGNGGKKVGIIIGAIVAVVAIALIAMFAAHVGPFAPSTTTIDLGEHTQNGSTEGASPTVGDYAGMTQEDAQEAVEKDGFTVGDITESHSDSVEEGCVISQGIEAGSQADEGTAISLEVSSGPVPHSYTLVEQDMTWSEAKSYCESQGGYLVCINSSEENEEVKSLISGSSCTLFWIGAQRDSSGNFVWVNGDEMSFTGWAAGEPNNDGGNENVAAIFQTANGTAWYDTLNDVSAYYRPTTMAFVMETEESE